MRTQGPQQTALRGLLTGMSATVPMTVVMTALHDALPGRRRPALPPFRVTGRILGKLGLPPPGPATFTAAGTLAHFAFGAAVGAAYGRWVRRLPTPPRLTGVAYALAVWAGSYHGLLPAAGVYQKSERRSLRCQITLALSHVVWGLTLGRMLPPRGR